MKAIYLALLLLSAATLAFQVVLIRLFALAQGSHLAFMAISLALLGVGASGTYLSVRPPPAAWPGLIGRAAMLFALTVPAAYLAINYLPFDAYRLAWEPLQLLWLALYYLALTMPFFFSGLVVGAALAAQPEQAGPLYAANLLGAGLGPPLALLALDRAGGPGAIFLCALLGWLALGFWILDFRFWIAGIAFYVLRFTFYVAIALALTYFTFRPPALFDVRLTPYKALSQALLYPGSEILLSQWNAFSRVDVIRSQGIRSAPGLSFAYRGDLPPQLGLTVDGDNLTPLTKPITQPGRPGFSQALPLALGFQLRPGAKTLILEPGGGLAVLTALQNGAGTVMVVHSNPTVAAAIGWEFADFSGGLYADPRVTVVVDEPRSFLRRTGQQFDLIILPLTDNFRPVTAGAYTLNEDYRYTVEAFTDILAHLSPTGLLLVERWLQLPPSECLRLWALVVEALDRFQGQSAEVSQTSTVSATHLLALRSLQTLLVGAARSPLPAEEIAVIRNFAADRQYDLVWLPDLQPEETNRYSVLAEPVYYMTFAGLLATPDRAEFYASYPYTIAPPTDDHPFFFHFFKWGQTPQIIESLGRTWQPFGGSGYLVLAALLALVTLLSAGLILLPLAFKRAAPGRSPRRISVSALLYFGLLGLGFLFVEIPLLQRFILYLGQPAYAFAVVTSALLVASGVGSGYLSGRWPLRRTLLLISLLILLYPLLLPPLFNLTLPLPFAGRVGIAGASLFPLGLLLGIPFPRGLALAGPALTPWAWAVNGCASVISAILAAMTALTWSFSAVLWSAALAYALAAALTPMNDE